MYGKSNPLFLSAIHFTKNSDYPDPYLHIVFTWMLGKTLERWTSPGSRSKRRLAHSE